MPSTPGARSPPPAGGVPKLFRTYVEQLNWAYRDGYPELRFMQSASLFTLYLLMRYGDLWRPHTFYEDSFLRAFPAVLDEVPPGPVFTPEEEVRNCYTWRTLVHFAGFLGLATVEPTSDKFLCREYRLKALPYIESGNAGLDDDLYAVAYTTCYTDHDWRALAEAFETMGGDWKLGHARRIYRRLDDRDRYLELRQRKLVTGTDYHDLADFHWKAGEKRKAMAVAEEGLRQGKGRMDELRQFVAKRAKSAGNRERYLALQFEQAIDPLTCDKYKAFRKLCMTAEWKSNEAKILARLKTAWDTEQIRIRMHRKEYGEAVAVLGQSRYPRYAWDSAYELQTARHR